jgi:hypothetical protein
MIYKDKKKEKKKSFFQGNRSGRKMKLSLVILQSRDAGYAKRPRLVTYLKNLG